MDPTATTDQRPTRPLDVLVVTGGHPFQAEPFFEIFAGFDDIVWHAATAPTTGHDVVVFYDMPGITFTRSDPPTTFAEPSDAAKQCFSDLAEAGVGLVFMHHAVAGWPAWEGYAEMIGGRFHYQPADLRGVAYPDSGYRFDVAHTVEVIAAEHPVCAGLPEHFEITDELYCFPVFEADVEPLMRTTYPVDDDQRFYSADLAIRGMRHSNDGWNHPPGSALVGWTKPWGRSRLVYLQFGDGPVTYADPWFRHVLHNAITWSAAR